MAKAPTDLRSLARAHTELGIQTLAGIARNSTPPPRACPAAGMPCSTGVGQGPQPHTGEDGEIRVTLRNNHRG